MRHYLSVASAALNCVRREAHWIDHNPIENIKMPKASRKVVRFLNAAELSSLLEVCAARSQDLLDFVLIALYTGARAGELLKITWNDVHWDNERILLGKTKNGRSRQLVLNADAMTILRRRDAERKEGKVRSIDSDRERIFIRIGGRDADDYGSVFRKTVKAAGIEPQ